MEINIKNCGPVEECDILLKPLTIFIGPNGTGKTWTASVIAYLFSTLNILEYSKAYSKGLLSEKYELIDDITVSLANSGSAKINLVDFFEKYSNQFVNNLARFVPSNMPRFFGSQRISFENLKLDIQFDSSDFIPYLQERLPLIEDTIGSNDKEEPLLKIYTLENDSNFYVYTRSSSEIKEEPEYIIKSTITKYIFDILSGFFYNDVFFLSAERTGLIPFINTFGYSDDKMRIDPELIKNVYRDEDTFSISMVSLLLIVSSAFKQNVRKKRLESSNRYIQKYIELSQILEQQIMGGNVEIVLNENGNQKLLYRVNEKNDVFDLSASSSNIKGLVYLVLYLRYVAKKGDLILIDEPEMNLHPEAQVQIMELLAMMVNCGLNIIVTTHSPYLVDHISNLTKAYNLKEDHKTVDSGKFKLDNENCFLNANKVSVYLFNNHTSKSIYSPDGFVDWGTFGNVSEYVSNLYFELGD